MDEVTGREQRLIGKYHSLTLKRIANDLAAENSKQLDYINAGVIAGENLEHLSYDAEENIITKPREFYLAQWRDGVEGQARVLFKYAPHDYDIGTFFHMSGYSGTHPDLSGIEKVIGKEEKKHDPVYFSSEDEAKIILHVMKTILVKFGYVTVSDLHDLCGLPSAYLESRMGWRNLDDVGIMQEDSKYFLDLPKAESIL